MVREPCHDDMDRLLGKIVFKSCIQHQGSSGMKSCKKILKKANVKMIYLFMDPVKK